MAGTGHGETGRHFENLIDTICKYYRNGGIAMINKEPTPISVLAAKGRNIHRAIYTEKATVDYKGIYQGTGVAMEAKAVNGKSFPLANAKRHQIQYLREFEDIGGLAFYLIQFTEIKRSFVILPGLLEEAEKVQRAGGRKSIPLAAIEADGCEVTKNGMIPLDFLGAATLLKKQWEGSNYYK